MRLAGSASDDVVPLKRWWWGVNLQRLKGNSGISGVSGNVVMRSRQADASVMGVFPVLIDSERWWRRRAGCVSVQAVDQLSTGVQPIGFGFWGCLVRRLAGAGPCAVRRGRMVAF